MPSYNFCLVFLAVFVQQICPTVARPLSSRQSEEDPTRLVYEFPKGSWIENIAVRSNGDLLVTRIDVPELYLISSPSSSSPTAQLLYTFPDALATLGIAETTPDRFAVIAGNYTFTAGATPGSFSVWNVDLSKTKSSTNGTPLTPPAVSKIVDLQAGLGNGMSSLDKSTVLIADSDAGAVYRLNVDTGNYSVASTDPLLAPNKTAAVSIGVNGIHVRENYLYFTNTGQSLFGRFPIRSDGTQSGKASVIARPLNSSEGYDDFTYDSAGNFYFSTGPGNSVEKLTPDGHGSIIAGSLNTTEIAEPTSAAIGRGATDKNILYVATGGGLAIPVNGDLTVGAQVVAVDLSGQKSRRGIAI